MDYDKAYILENLCRLQGLTFLGLYYAKALHVSSYSRENCASQINRQQSFLDLYAHVFSYRWLCVSARMSPAKEHCNKDRGSFSRHTDSHSRSLMHCELPL